MIEAGGGKREVQKPGNKVLIQVEGGDTAFTFETTAASILKTLERDDF